jgi:hypothetical protein
LLVVQQQSRGDIDQLSLEKVLQQLDMPHHFLAMFIGLGHRLSVGFWIMNLSELYHRRYFLF